MMAHRNGKEPVSSSDEKTSSSSSDGSESTPTTPPSPHVFPQQQTSPYTPPQQPIRNSPQNGRFSATGGRSPKLITPKSKLGAINEDSDEISPDIPQRNPLRRLGQSMKFSIPAIPTLYATRKPKNIYDDIEGPRGEKFSDVRSNSKTKQPRACGWRSLVCLACILLVVAAVVAIGVIVGLRVKKNKESNRNVPNTQFSLNNTFPSGTYSISTYLNTVSTACTSNPSTWRCYPYTTYAQSATSSISSLTWSIASLNNMTYVISSGDPVFSYPFTNTPLQRVDNGTDNERWTFTYTYDKVVFPNASITNDGTTAKCFYNNTKLVGNLYTRKQKIQSLNSTGSANAKAWPYALDFSETKGTGAGVPDCYKLVNGVLGERVNVPLASNLNGGECQCGYTDWFS